ncbi:MAG: hypothetical protein HOQ33_06565, partial [Cupriavidus sp.]|nr:hypothetical protein [Cupriavidus sp.]
ALGTDTGGSIRVPAACCGVAGLKPTHGRVSRRGALPAESSLDCIGPLAASMEGIVAAMAVIAPGMAQSPGASACSTACRRTPPCSMPLPRRCGTRTSTSPMSGSTAWAPPTRPACRSSTTKPGRPSAT